MSKVFVSTDARRACPRGVIGSTMGVYPRGTGSNPVQGNGHFFRSCRQLYFPSFSHTHTHTHTPFVWHFLFTVTRTHSFMLVPDERRMTREKQSSFCCIGGSLG